MKIKRRRNNSISSDNDTESKKRKIMPNKECTIISDKVEIIKLTEVSDEDSDNDDCDWEDVSDLSETNSIILNLREIVTADPVKDDKRKLQRLESEFEKIIQRTFIMSLFARVLHVNTVCRDEFLMNMALSRFPHKFLNFNSNTVTSVNIRNILLLIKDQFKVINDFDESGGVNNILKQSLMKAKVSTAWINVVASLILRSNGFRVRLIGFLYPTNCDVKMAVAPTTYRKSTRGFQKPKKVTKKPSISLPSTNSPKIIFIMEVLSVVTSQWITVDMNDLATFDDVEAVVRDFPKFFYVVAIDNDGVVKDVAARYDAHWADSSRRSRVSRLSWECILRPFLSADDSEIDRLENEAMKNGVLKRGVPQTLADLKGHPFFVLRRNLLKYEIVYPENVEPFGQFNDEDVYLRDNVKVAHTRETWLKEAMVVKDGETPCKRVKTMMATRKQKTHGTDPFVDIFGPWQIEPFIPPKAKDGIVPINNHGNVDLFKPCMVPDGCIHIRMNGVDKVSKKLNIDCVPAMVGWGFVKGHRAVPILDGWVVCRENVRLLKDALMEWNRLEAIKQAEKREKIVVKRWEILTRRILVRERLRVEYNF